MSEGENEVWVSNIQMNTVYGRHAGMKTLYNGFTWETTPTSIHEVPDETYKFTESSLRGHTLKREELPIASIVVDEKRFPKRRKFFHLNGFMAFMPPLSDVIGSFNLGKGGMVRHPVFYKDGVTPYPAEVFILNFGGPKDTFSKEYTAPDMLQPQLPPKKPGFIQTELWERCPEDGEIAVTERALEGDDIWIETYMQKQIFMRGTVARKLQKTKAGVNWALTRCKIVKLH